MLVVNLVGVKLFCGLRAAGCVLQVAGQNLRFTATKMLVKGTEIIAMNNICSEVAQS